MQPNASPLAPDVLSHNEDAGLHRHQSGWLRASIIAGFVSTFAMTACIAIAYGLANSLGTASGNSLQRWLYALSNNRLTEHVSEQFLFAMVANLVMGLVWAVIYARFAEPHLAGPGWWRGMCFSLVPFVLTIVVFFPIAGVGIFARDTHAGPLPVAGALVLHLIYGALLGAFYAIDVMVGLEDARGEREAAEAAERGAAIGIGIGAILGFIAGWLVWPQMESLASRPVIGLAGALSGAALGIVLGSLFAMTVDESSPENEPR